MATIDTLNPAVPADNIAVAGVPDAIRDVVVALQTTFPALVGVSTLAAPATQAITWGGTIASVTSSCRKNHEGLVTFNLFGTISMGFTHGTPASNSLSVTDMTGFIPPAAAVGVPALPAWGRMGGNWYLLGYLTLLSTGISVYFTGDAPTGTYDRINVNGCFNVN